MIKSMTGYGAGSFAEADGEFKREFKVELKAVNHKYFDLSVRMPRAMLCLEERVRKYVAKSVSRGKMDVFINFAGDCASDNVLMLNEALGDSLYKGLQAMKERYGFDDEITLSHMFRFPNLFATDTAKNEVVSENAEELWDILEPALKEALHNFLSMREKEGEAIKHDALVKVAAIDEIVVQIEEKAPSICACYKEKLEARIRELNEGRLDEQRLMLECAIFADKASVDEEITRLKSHTKQFEAILEENVPIGKKLDFLVQEMMRESNTIGSKANSLEITKNILLLKSEIEKIREQIQNIE